MLASVPLYARLLLLACGCIASAPLYAQGQSQDFGPASVNPSMQALPLGPLSPPPWITPSDPLWQPPPTIPAPSTHVGCRCLECKAAATLGGVHRHRALDTLPLYAPTELEWSDAAWLPEIREEWIGQPVGGGAFAGMLIGDEIIPSKLELKSGVFTGIRFGQDYGVRWSVESRFAYANPDVVNLQGPELRRRADFFLADTSLVYARYFWKRLRPYASVGAGGAYLVATDHLGDRLHEFMTVFPVGVGLKYRYHDQLIIRLDIRDNIMLGQDDLVTSHNFSLAGGVEFRFGGNPSTYHPWNPSRHMW